jgi:hypothetical protein
LILGPEGVFSGLLGPCLDNPDCANDKYKNEGPIPLGNYKMNEDEREGHETFWRLEPDPPISGWDCNRKKRCGFMLHPGTLSLGCNTADPTNEKTMRQYGRIDGLLLEEKGANTLKVIP